MLSAISKKTAEVLGAMLVVSFIVFLVLEANVEDVAVKVLGAYSAPDQRAAWLAENGYNDPFLVRYVRWLWDFVTLDWGQSTLFRVPVTDVLPQRLAATGVLAGATLALMVPIALVLGIVAGMREGSATDRSVSFFSVLTTSIPEFATAVFLSAIFVFWLGWLPGASTMISGFSITELILPVSVLTLYSAGYLARITRASMVEAMRSPYVRTALMKGASTSRIVLHHALRNALIAPVTVVMLQIPWLLSGVIVVEVFFAYKGFGTLLYEAALNSDVFLIEACAMVSVVVVVATQLISDILYRLLNPRLRVAVKPAGATA
ncbi:ABC transporter permease [Chthonobacter rhizosphaerae]|uniref:ABC transporter permease n=1 Tax=Chthonobacter rhizosphaerae TaxID=2735553 RepID=UPI0015EEFC8A|nr:ABC transporter permease [Chthonobacter rhizosphaerae]